MHQSAPLRKKGNADECLRDDGRELVHIFMIQERICWSNELSTWQSADCITNLKLQIAKRRILLPFSLPLGEGEKRNLTLTLSFQERGRTRAGDRADAMERHESPLRAGFRR